MEERSRISAKGWLTRPGKKVENVITEHEDTNEWKAEATAVLLEFDKRMNAFDEAQAAVEGIVDEKMLMEEIERADMFKDSFSKVRARLEVMITSMPARKAGDVKLPKLDLPLFKGAYEQWPTFWEAFEACVVNTGMPEVNKFTYLRSLLRGEASRSIEGLSLTAAHFKDACELLRNRYGRPEKLRFLHIEQMLNLKASACGDLKKLQDTLLVHIRSLEALDVKGDEYGVFLTPLVLSKLPDSVRLEWARGAEGKEGNLHHLLQFLEDEVKRQERSGTFAARSPSARTSTENLQPTQQRWDRKLPQSPGRPAAAADDICGGELLQLLPAAACIRQLSCLVQPELQRQVPGFKG